jgi:hypothetical protein
MPRPLRAGDDDNGPVQRAELTTEAARATERALVLNAMSVDVEDYFHVSVFDGIVPRATWAQMESRVCANTHRLLDIFDEFGVSSTFFVLGWVAERHPDLVRTIAARGHEIASHGYAHRLVYDQTPAAFREDVRRAKHLLEDAAGCLSCAQLVCDAAIAVGAGCADRGGIRLRCQHLSHSS